MRSRFSILCQRLWVQAFDWLLEPVGFPGQITLDVSSSPATIHLVTTPKPTAQNAAGRDPRGRVEV